MIDPRFLVRARVVLAKSLNLNEISYHPFGAQPRKVFFQGLIELGRKANRPEAQKLFELARPSFEKAVGGGAFERGSSWPISVGFYAFRRSQG